MDVVGLSAEERDRIFRVVMAVLHLGDVMFDPTFDNNEEGTKISSECQESVDALGKLLEVDTAGLEAALCSRVISARGVQTKKPHNLQQAEEARDALCMGLYERLFLWTVWRVNQSISTIGFHPAANDRARKKAGYNHQHTISCLDIFGFEVFDKNSFEQLCINYANEVLQQLFNEYVFKIEQKFYEAEGINWKAISFPDNHETIRMIEGKPIGMLQLIDEECMFPGGNDTSLHEKLYGNMKKFKAFSVDDDTQKKHNLFSVNHFAGLVEYSTDEFCAKNKNELRQEAIEFIRSSKDSLIQILLPPDAATASGAASSEYFTKLNQSGGKKKKKKKPAEAASTRAHKTQKLQQRTVGAYFKEQLLEAMEFLRASEPHFVRCIKPNDYNVAAEMDRNRTVEQLNYSGVLEAVRIARAGYSSRFILSEFAVRFRCLYEGRITAKKQSDYKKICVDILRNTGLVEMDDWQVGHTKVFLRTEAYSTLESKKRERLYDSTALIQKNVRIFLLKMVLYRRYQERMARLNKSRVPEAPKEKRVAPEPPPRRTQKYGSDSDDSEREDDDNDNNEPERGERANQAEGFDLNNIDVNKIVEYVNQSVQKVLAVSDPEALKKVVSDDPVLVAAPICFLIFFFDPKLFLNMLGLMLVGGLGFMFLKEQQRANTLKMQQKRAKKAKKKAKKAKKSKKAKKFKMGQKKKMKDYESDVADEYEELKRRRTKRTQRARQRRNSEYFLNGMSLKRTNSGRIVYPEK